MSVIHEQPGKKLWLVLTAARRLVIREDPQAASQYVADYIVERIKAFDPTPEKPFVLGLPTGSSPEIVYRLLVQKYKAGQVSFRNVITFNMDEYVALPPSHPQSYHTYMYTNLFSHVDIPPQNIHILNGNAPDLAAECAAYERAMAAVGGIELFVAGLGPAGHIAFNEAGSSLQSRTRAVVLAQETREANKRFFAAAAAGAGAGDEAAAAVHTHVPTHALTVGVATILSAREVLALATGAHKAHALHHCLEKGVNHMWTLSALQLHARPVIVVDEDATAELRVRTVRYWKGCEEADAFRDAAKSCEEAEAGAWPASGPKPKTTPDNASADSSRPRVPAIHTLTPPPSAKEDKHLVLPLPLPLLHHPPSASTTTSRATTPEPTLEAMGARISPVGVGVDGDGEVEFDERADAPFLRMGARVC